MNVYSGLLRVNHRNIISSPKEALLEKSIINFNAIENFKREFLTTVPIPTSLTFGHLTEDLWGLGWVKEAANHKLSTKE